jgi:diguanylate cyclase (GGDEF)-like protein
VGKTASAQEEGVGVLGASPRGSGPLEGRLSVRVFAFALAGALLPALTAAILFSRFAEGRELDSADARLSRELASATATFDELLASASNTAEELSTSAAVADALAARDRAGLEREVAGRPGVALVDVEGTVLAGGVSAPAAIRSAPVLSNGVAVGRVDVGVPIDRSLATRLAVAADLAPDDSAILTVAGRLIAGPGEPGVRLDLSRDSRELETDGRSYRLAGTMLAEGPPSVALAVATPLSQLNGTEGVLVAALVTALTLAALFALAVSWRAARRPASRPPTRRAADRRAGSEPRTAVREALALVGDALAATHNPRALAPVILETTMEATGAIGGRLLEDGEEVAQAGRFDGGRRPLELALAGEHGTATTLVLYPPRGGFSTEVRELAQWLADQAAIALESARLHRLVEQQAITDELTHLANRRRFMEILELELSRAERFEGTVTIVLADLDDFKSVNDRFGHQVGDSVLRAFAEVLTEGVRGIDMAARLGGEEFAVLLPQTDMRGGMALAERLRVALAERGLDLPGGERLHVTASFGVAFYPGASSVSDLLNSADQALYVAKREGKNRVVAARL